MSDTVTDRARMLEQLAKELARDEGEVLHAYQDSEGLWTIGIGCLIDRRRGGGITHEEAVYLLGNRVAAKEAELDRAIPWWRGLSPARQRVILNMAYNMGVGDAASGLLSFHDTLAAIQRGDWKAAAAGMKASKWARQVGERADRLEALLLKG